MLFINRSYWPDGEATGQLLTELSEDLADRFEISVVVGRPNANPSGEHFRGVGSQVRNGVRILRVPHTRLPKGWLPGRAINFATFVASATVRATFCRRQDLIVVETDPFLLALLGRLLRFRHRSRQVVYLQDIHPDVGIAVGRLKENTLLRTLRRMLISEYRLADRVVVLSRDMRSTLIAAGVPEASVTRLPNWTDTNTIRPTAQNNRFRESAKIARHDFLVMYSGNLGVTQQLDQVLEVASRLRSRPGILFAFVGGGSAEPALRSDAERRGLTNVRFFPYRTKHELGDSLSAADLQLVTVHPAALPFLMPSKLYGILAAGRPVLAAAPAESELAQVVRDNRVGYVVPPGDLEAMTCAIVEAADHRDENAALGDRARRLAEEAYDRPKITGQFGDLLDEILSESEAVRHSVCRKEFNAAAGGRDSREGVKKDQVIPQ